MGLIGLVESTVRTCIVLHGPAIRRTLVSDRGSREDAVIQICRDRRVTAGLRSHPDPLPMREFCTNIPTDRPGGRSGRAARRSGVPAWGYAFCAGVAVRPVEPDGGLHLRDPELQGAARWPSKSWMTMHGRHLRANRAGHRSPARHVRSMPTKRSGSSSSAATTNPRLNHEDVAVGWSYSFGQSEGENKVDFRSSPKPSVMLSAA